MLARDGRKDMTEEQKKDRRVYWERRLQSVLISGGMFMLLWWIPTGVEALRKLDRIDERTEMNTVAISGAYSADDAAKDVRAINSRIDATSREIEELGQRMAAIESRKNTQTSGSRR
jgi:hypothetical protein